MTNNRAEAHGFFGIKSKKELIILLILFSIFLIGFIYVGKIEKQVVSITDAQKIHMMYKEVPEDNIFKFMSTSTAFEYIKQDDVILLFGVENNDYVGYIANMLNTVALEYGLHEIYFCDITSDRKNSNGTYELMVNYLENYLPQIENNGVDILTPSILIKKNGNIISFDDNYAIIDGKKSAKEFFNNYELNNLKNNLRDDIGAYNG